MKIKKHYRRPRVWSRHANTIGLARVRKMKTDVQRFINTLNNDAQAKFL